MKIITIIYLLGATATTFLILWMLLELITAPMRFDQGGIGKSYSELDPFSRMGICAVLAVSCSVPGWIRAYLKRA